MQGKMMKTIQTNHSHKTAGELSLEYSKKNDKILAVDMQREILNGTNSKRSFLEEVEFSAHRGRQDPNISRDFFVVCLLKKERLLQNIVRPYYFYRQTCPTPDYDQTVYKVHSNGELEYIWTIPDIDTCNQVVINKHLMAEDHVLLISMVTAFNNGELLRYAKKLNKEVDCILKL
jgi:hypothetical protein